MNRDVYLLELDNILKRPSGRELFYNILLHFRYKSSSFDENPVKMAFNEGNRNCADKLAFDLKEANHDNFLKMLKENQ